MKDEGVKMNRNGFSFILPPSAFILALVLLAFPACQKLGNSKADTPEKRPQVPKNDLYGPPKVLAELKSREIDESSGLVAAQLTGVYWTHNDSGDGPFIYAIDEIGASRGVWRVGGAENHDWEDIAAGPGPDTSKRYLYIGDIGDNDDNRKGLIVYRISEPTITDNDAATSRQNPRVTESAEVIRLRFPDGKHDAETLMVHPKSGDLYIVTKVALENAVVYKAAAPLPLDKQIVMTRLNELDLRNLVGGAVTGGDISPDGRRVALCDYLQGYEATLPATSNNFDDIWKQPMIALDLGKRKQGESIAYRLDGKALLATSEGKHSPLIEVLRR
jgi:hypothetical protein